MDLSIRDLLKEKNAGISALGLRNQEAFLKQSAAKMYKLKLESEKANKIIYHLELAMPFNPLTGSDEEYNSKCKYISPVSNTSTVLAIKEEMRQSPALHKFYAAKLDKSEDDYDISTDEITADDELLFGRWRRPMHISETCQKFSFEAFGDFGRKMLVKVETGEDGTLKEASLGYHLYLLEYDLFLNERRAIMESYDTGEKAGQPDKDMKDDIKAARNKMRVAKPRRIGFLPHLAIPIDYATRTLEAETVKTLKQNIGRFSSYSSGSDDDFTRVRGYIGSISDTHFDYIEVDMMSPSVDDLPEKEKSLGKYKRRDFQTNPVKPVDKAYPAFDVQYRKFRDDLDNFDEKSIFQSIPEFTFPDDDTIIEHYKQEFISRKKWADEAVLVANQKIINRISSEDSDKALDAILNGSVAKQRGAVEIDQNVYSDFTEDKEAEQDALDALKGLEIEELV